MIKKPQPQINAFTTHFSGPSGKLYNRVLVMSEGKKTEAVALWDTGATGTCISEELAEKLNLVSVGKRQVHTPSGQSVFDDYCIDLVLPNNTGIKGVRVTATKIGQQQIDVLIGMDIICLGDFAVSTHNGKTQFTFRTPSVADADFVENQKDGFKGIPVVREGKKVQPNDPCPCGSGMKYKFCHGKT